MFVRSGENAFEAQGRLRGWNESALTDNGKQDTRALAREFCDFRFDHAYASSLQRAQETAAITLLELKQEVSIETQAALRPRNWGFLNGWNTTDVAAKFGASPFNNWCTGTTAPPGGESIRDVAERVAPFVLTLLSPRSDRTILIACHDSVLAAVRAWEHESQPTNVLNELRRVPFLIYEW